MALDAGPNVLDVEAWAMDIARLNEYDEALAVTQLPVAVTARLGEFRRRCQSPSASHTFCEVIESWSREQYNLPT